jgi:hypothetical protein
VRDVWKGYLKPASDPPSVHFEVQWRITVACAALVASMLVAACGGSTGAPTGNPTATPAPTSQPTPSPTSTVAPVPSGDTETGQASEGNTTLYIVVTSSSPAGLKLIDWPVAVDGDPATNIVDGSHPVGMRTCTQSFTHDGYDFTVSFFAPTVPADDAGLFSIACANAPEGLFTDSPENS